MFRRKVRKGVGIVLATLFTGFTASMGLFSAALKAAPDRTADSFQLSNGLKVIFQNNDVSEITICQILIRGGKKAEPSGKEGLSYITTRLALEFPDFQTLQIMMDQATELNIVGGMDHTQINISCLSDNFDETVKQVSQLLLDPLFSSIRIDSIKKMMGRTKEIQEEDPLAIAHQSVIDGLFAGTPYALSPYGTKESLKSIKKKDIDTYYENYFLSSNMAIGVISDFSRAEVQGILEKYFKAIPSGQAKTIEANFSAPALAERTVSIEKDTKQTLIMAAYPLPGISSRNYILSHFLYYLIGHGANSKLWPLRLEKKLAYNVNTRLDLFVGGGALEAYLETDSERKEVAQKAMNDILLDLYERGLTEEELLTTKSYFKGAFIRQIESKTDRMQVLIDFESLGLGYEFLDRIFQEIDATSLEEINGFIKVNLDPDTRLDITVGPLKSF